MHCMTNNNKIINIVSLKEIGDFILHTSLKLSPNSLAQLFQLSYQMWWANAPDISAVDLVRTMRGWQRKDHMVMMVLMYYVYNHSKLWLWFHSNMIRTPAARALSFSVPYLPFSITLSLDLYFSITLYVGGCWRGCEWRCGWGCACVCSHYDCYKVFLQWRRYDYLTYSE